MTDFDPIKATREELIGLTDVHKTIQARSRHSESVLAEAEAEHNALIKMDGFLRGMISGMQARLRALEDEAERKAST